MEEFRFPRPVHLYFGDKTAWEAIRMGGTVRKEIRRGMKVRVVQKQDQKSGRLTEGVVLDILTKSPTHPHGIKVRLENGIVGRVHEVLAESV
jgi:uncharacterized repeat protein (TIGR03833 family)